MAKNEFLNPSRDDMSHISEVQDIPVASTSASNHVFPITYTASQDSDGSPVSGSIR